MSKVKSKIMDYLVVNPYSDTDIEIMKQFEQDLHYELPVKTSQILLDLRKKQSEKKYLIQKKQENEIEENLLWLKNGKAKSSCYIQGDKETSTCELMLVTPKKYQNKGYSSKLLIAACTYAVKEYKTQSFNLYILNSDLEAIEAVQRYGFRQIENTERNPIYSFSYHHQKEKNKELIYSNEKY